MIFYTPIFVIRTISESEEDPEQSFFHDYYNRWSNDADIVELDTRSLTLENLQQIIDFIKLDVEVQKNEKILKLEKSLLNKHARYLKLLAEGDTIKLTNLKMIPTTFESWVKSLPNSRFFAFDESDRMVPYVATNSKYIAAHTSYGTTTPAHVVITFEAVRANEKISESLTIWASSLAHKPTIAVLLENNGYLVEDDELNAEYERLQEKLSLLMKSTGHLYTGSGVAKIHENTRWGYRNSRYYFKNDGSTKVIIDNSGHIVEDPDNRSKTDTNVIAQTSSRLTGEQITLPIHPYIFVFHLDEHRWLFTHIDALTKYEYAGKSLSEKLVLPAEHKLLINILMQSSKINIQDIVKGKMGGSFIMSTGKPGTGKTLTAEVFSETVEVPLYSVQCSQLGLNIDSVEKNLKLVLSRASRWGAILLIDEADVYVRARGTDINQNAIVGVFLRTLEYYNGILFMTSNLETQIDDAIMSRATAHIRYTVPTTDELLKIWTILNAQFDTKLTAEGITTLVESMPNIVGRDVKSLLKLSKMYAQTQNIDITPELIMSLSVFVPNVNLTK